MFEKTVTVIGGCGHVGLPLALCLAEAGFRVHIHDINAKAVELVKSGRMPFHEEGADAVLPAVLRNGSLTVSTDPAAVSESRFVVCVVGTPVDEYLNPTVHRFFGVLEKIRPYLRDGQVLVLRSTLYPETSKRVQHLFESRGPKVEVTFCPERVAQGRGYLEIKSLPQIVSAFTDRGRQAARFLFEQLGVEIIDTEPLEAELIKLFNNVWRYLTFSVANQFFSIANDYGIDYYRIHHGLTHHYPRGASIPKPGFAAGPCLFKDTMQLAAFSNNQFFLGHAAMLVNEGLPLYVVQRLERRFDLETCTVGILGMAFKANCDDIRDSLAFKLRKILATRCRLVLCSDSHVRREDILAFSSQIRPEELVDAETLIERSDIIIIGVPHSEYRLLDFGETPVIDIWNSLEQGAVV